MGKSAKRPLESENEQNERISDEVLKDEPIEAKKARLFNAKEFRQQIQTDDKLNVLRNFLVLCKERYQDCIHEYLEKGGNCMELLQLLEGSQTIPQIIVLEIMNLILLRISRGHPKQQSGAFEACRYLLNTHINMINKMLNLTSSAKERRVILKLLTAVIAFSVNLAKDILIHVNFHSASLELLTKNTGEGAASVRNAFLHFLTAFLVEGHYPTISVLLEKRGLLTSIINGLQFDVSDSVCLVLLALKTHVLENPLVSKTVKMKTFSTPVVRDLVNLYNWKGPEGFDAKKRRRIVNVQVDEYEKTKVSQTVHDFLLILCTSFKFGVIFKDRTLGLGKKQQNGLMFTVLESLERPWEHSYASDLITKICGSCPDLVKTMWSNMKLFLEPRLTVKWLNAMNFASVLLEQLHPSSVEFCIKDFNSYQFTQMVQFLVAPTTILKTIIPEKYESQTVKTNILKLLANMLKSINLYVESATNFFNPDFVRSIKSLLNDHIARNFPNAQNILQNWQQIDAEIVEGFQKFTIIDNLEPIFNIFESYEKLCPQLLEGLNISLDLVDFLNEIKSLNMEVDDSINLDNSLTDFDETIIKTDNSKEIILMQVKAIKLFLNFDSSLFTSKSNVFEIVVPLILENYFQSRDVFSKNTLTSILINTGIFESCEFEISIWLDAIFNLKNYHTSVGQFLVAILQKTCNNLDYLNQISALKSNLNDTTQTINFNEILANLCEDNSTQIRIKHNNFSPLILGCFDHLIDSKQTKHIKLYINLVVINLFHSQTNASLFLNLIKPQQIIINANIYNYFMGWMQNDVIILEKLKGKVDFLPHLSQALLTGDSKIFLSQPQLKPNQIISLQMCIFYLGNLNENLNEKIVISATEIVKTLLETHHEIILLNPNLLHKFNPLYLEKNCDKGLITRFLIDIVKFVQNCGGNNNLDALLEPYRTKLFISLLKVLKKDAKAKKFEQLTAIIEIFDLGYEACRDLLILIAKIDSNAFINEENVLTLVYNLTIYCINKIALLCQNNYALAPLEGEIITNLCAHFVHLNKQPLSDTSLFASAFKKYFERFPHNYKDLNADLFESILQKSEYCKENSILASDFLENRCDFLTNFEANIDLICNKKGLLLPLLESAIKVDAKADILMKVFKKFEPSLCKAMQKPQKAGQHFEKHFQGVVTLLKKCAGDAFCKVYLEKIHKFESSEIFHVHLLRTIYEKYLLSDKINEKYLNNCMLTFVHLIVGLFKRKTKSDDDWERLMNIIEIVDGFINKIPINKAIDFKQVSDNETFKLYSKFSLKFGINNKGGLLKLLGTFSKLIKYSEEEAVLMMEMIASHSEFLELLLNEDSVCKVELLKLVLVHCGNYPKVMQKNHIPIFLGAYRATMRASDRIILQLLKLYESVPAQTNFYDFKPFLWGRAAVNHYSVRSDLQKALWRQPRTGDVLDILQESWVCSTIKDYPLKLDLNATTPTNLDENAMKFVYDLSFILPLFSALLASENTVQTYRFTKSGALSLTVIALSSDNKEVRMAACHVLARFYYHLESKHTGKDNLLWIRFVEAVCRGTAVIESFQINNFSAIFLSRTALILTQPQHVMYVPLSQYLGAKSAPDFTSIPELYTLLHSSDLNFREHRCFILEILADGLRTEADFEVALRSMGFKIIMELYQSSIADLEAQKLILQVLKRATKFTNGSKLLCNSYGLISWLHGIIAMKNHPFLIKDIIVILANIVNANVVDLNGLKKLYQMILDDYLDVKLSDDVVKVLLNSLIILFDNKVNCFTDKNFRKMLLYVDENFCTYLLDFKYNISCIDDGSVSSIIRKLTCKMIE